MSQKTALVIGGDGGIGSATSKVLLKDSWQVCGTYHVEGENLKNIKEELTGQPIKFYQLDFFSNSVEADLLKIIEECQSVEAVIFCATAPINHKPLISLEWDDFKNHLTVQVEGVFRVMKAMKEQILSKQRRKFIVLLSEVCIGRPPVGLTPYVVAKYGLMGLVKAMTVELAPYNCTVNFVSPGMTETNLIKDFPSKLVEVAALNNPLKRIAKPEDVANVIAFLVSEKADYLNGAHITVNGGSIML
ncbi:MAG: SDR family oxidoreductase [bacterium]|nr:SDR family oxidoreductase [bacterium]